MIIHPSTSVDYIHDLMQWISDEWCVATAVRCDVQLIRNADVDCACCRYRAVISDGRRSLDATGEIITDALESLHRLCQRLNEQLDGRVL